MSSKVLPLLQLEAAVATRHNSFDNAADATSNLNNSSKTKSSSVKIQRQLSRANSGITLLKEEGSLGGDESTPTRKQLSRQNSLQGSSKNHRGMALTDHEEYQDNSFTVRSENNTARLQSSLKGMPSVKRMDSSINLSSQSSRKRVMFNVPLVDPTPERAPCQNSIDPSEFSHGAEDYSSSPAASRRKGKYQNGRFQAQSPLRHVVRSLTLAYRSFVRFTDRLF